MALLVGCTAAQPPQPTSVPAVPPTAAPAATAAANAIQTVNGQIDSINGRVLTVTTNTGAKQVQLTEDAKIEQEGKGSVSDLLPGLSVAVTGKPDANNNVTALLIRIFPSALGTPRPGQFPMTGANQGNLMTNSVIESFDGSKMTLNAGGQRYEIAVPPDTQVFKPVPATLNALTQGTRVLAAGTLGPDGSLRATSISIVGAPPQ
jgi:hypothetical protein